MNRALSRKAWIVAVGAGLWACAGTGAGTPGGGTGGSSSLGGAATGGAAMGGMGTGGAATGGSSATGGAAASGGAAGMGAGGVAGAPASGGAGGTTTANGPCAAPGIIACDDFESGIKTWTVSPGGQVVLDTSKHHSGATSIKIVGTNAPNNHISSPAGQLPTNNSFYVRAWVNFEKDTASIGGHVSYIVGSVADDNSGDELRMGSSKNLKGNDMLDLNWQGPGHSEITQFSNGDVNGVGGGTDNAGITLMADHWYCLEAFFNGAQSEFQAWLDETEITGLHVTDWGGQRAGAQRAWAPQFKFAKVGAQNYSGTIGTIWYDDVAVGSQRIHCQ